MNSIFDVIANAKANQSGNYIKPGGKYLWEVNNILIKDGNNGRFFIMEAICRESVATGETDRAGKVMVPTAVGAMGSIAINLTDPKQKSAAGNVKSFIQALFGVEESEVTAAVASECVSEYDAAGKVKRMTPCRGMLIRDEAWNKPQKADPSKDFTHHRWTNVKQTEDEIKVRKAELDKTSPL